MTHISIDIKLELPVSGIHDAQAIVRKVEFALRELRLEELTATIESTVTERTQFDTLSL